EPVAPKDVLRGEINADLRRWVCDFSALYAVCLNHQSPITFHLSPSARGSPRIIDKPWHETMFVEVFC
ncbi:MAG: hypothetical protein WAM44_20675, partial [Chthoniobacterales bacterium]